MFKKRKTSCDRKSTSARNNNASQGPSEPQQANYNRDLHYSFHNSQCPNSPTNTNKSSNQDTSVVAERVLFEELHKACYLIEPIPATSNKQRSQSVLSNLRDLSAPRATDEASPNNIIGYQYTYRAVLARKGYLVRNTLGSGSYSKVKKILNCNLSPVAVAAVKIIDRLKTPKDYQDKFMPRELELWPHLVHPNLVRLHDCFQDSRRVYMLLEYVPGGDALQYIQKNGAIPEKTAKLWARQILDAVGYMHEREISHRDLKLENLLLTEDKNVKICDFGFVKKQQDGAPLSRTYCGSRSYAAPEILMGRPYDPKKTDVWAIGVIVYIFVLGNMPFDETKGTKSVLKEQEGMEARWHRLRNRLTAPCHQLLLQMFAWDFEQRPDVSCLLLSPWFRKDSPSNHLHSNNSCSGHSNNNSSNITSNKVDRNEVVARPERMSPMMVEENNVAPPIRSCRNKKNNKTVNSSNNHNSNNHNNHSSNNQSNNHSNNHNNSSNHGNNSNAPISTQLDLVNSYRRRQNPLGQEEKHECMVEDDILFSIHDEEEAVVSADNTTLNHTLAHPNNIKNNNHQNNNHQNNNHQNNNTNHNTTHRIHSMSTNQSKNNTSQIKNNTTTHNSTRQQNNNTAPSNKAFVAKQSGNQGNHKPAECGPCTRSRFRSINRSNKTAI